MDSTKLPPNTAALWQRLQDESLLANSYLIGGTALALQIGHRISEDLDFVHPSFKLPRENIDKLIGQLQAEGYKIVRNDDPVAYDEFLIGGGSLHDYQQDFKLNDNTKLTFFADEGVTSILTSPLNPEKPVVPSTRELFDMKALVVEKRDKSRDWLDLYILMKDHKFTIKDFFAVYEKAGKGDKALAAFDKLATIPANFVDQGYNALIAPVPSLTDLRDYFVSQRSCLQQTPQQVVNHIAARAINGAANNPPSQGKGLSL